MLRAISAAACVAACVTCATGSGLVARSAVMSGASMEAGLGLLAFGLFLSAGFACCAAGILDTPRRRRPARRSISKG